MAGTDNFDPRNSNKEELIMSSNSMFIGSLIYYKSITCLWMMLYYLKTIVILEFCCITMNSSHN